VQL
jgi:hypothetical protein